METTELWKYQLINEADSIKQLQLAIAKIADEDGYIQGRSYKWDALEQSGHVANCINGIVPFNMLTRSYGIRQQALYLEHYQKL